MNASATPGSPFGAAAQRFARRSQVTGGNRVGPLLVDLRAE